MEKETLYPGSIQLEPMRYHNKLADAKVEKAMSSFEWAMQEKKDGALYMLEKTDEGQVYLFARTISKKTGELVEKIDNVPHIKEWAENHLPISTTLLGEIYVPGGKSNDVTKIMGALSQKAIERQFESDEFGGPLHYYVFDCLRLRGVDLTERGFGERFEKLKELSAAFEFNYAEIASTYTLNPEDDFQTIDNFEQYLSTIFENGGEGAVFKRLDGIYEPGKRPMQNFKLKEHVDSVDLVCMELLDPEYYYNGKESETWEYKNEEGELITKAAFYNWKNAMKIGAYKDDELVEVGRVASGLTDEMRADMAENPQNYIGQTIQVSCMSMNKKDKTLRHPVFECMRPDKNPQDCKIEEIF